MTGDRKAIVAALILFAILGAGILGLAAWLIAQLVRGGVSVDMVAFLTVLFMAFRDVISKMGACVRALNGQKLQDKPLDLHGSEIE